MMGLFSTVGIYLNGRPGGKTGESLLKSSALLKGYTPKASAERNRALTISHWKIKELILSIALTSCLRISHYAAVRYAFAKWVHTPYQQTVHSTPAAVPQPIRTLLGIYYQRPQSRPRKCTRSGREKMTE